MAQFSYGRNGLSLIHVRESVPLNDEPDFGVCDVRFSKESLF